MLDIVKTILYTRKLKNNQCCHEENIMADGSASTYVLYVPICIPKALGYLKLRQIEKLSSHKIQEMLAKRTKIIPWLILSFIKSNEKAINMSKKCKFIWRHNYMVRVKNNDR